MKVVVLLVGLVALQAGMAESQIMMEAHSFDSEVDHPTFLSRWWNAGTSIPHEDHIILMPSIADRFGVQWHKYPLHTNDFEATFTVIVTPPKTGSNPPNDQGFAFWYVYENVSDVMPESLTMNAQNVTERLASSNWGLYGYRNSFRGFGVVFANTRKKAGDAVPEFKPSVSVVVNDGSRNISVSADVPTHFGSFWNFRNGRLQVKVRVQKRSILLHARSDPAKDWIKLGEVPSEKLPMDITAGGYIGFTGAISSDRPSSTRPSQYGDHDAVYIDHVVLKNMDPTQKGEEVIAAPTPPTKPSSSAASHENLHSEFLHEQSDDMIESKESQAIKRFSHVLFKFISETEPQKKAMMSAVSTLSSKLLLMERAVKKLKQEIIAVSGHDMDADYAKMKAELASLSSKAVNNAAVKRQHLESLKSEIESSLDTKSSAKRASTAQVVKTLQEVDVKARDLKQQVASRGSFTMYIALFCLVLVVIAGIALQAKLKKWEKKHLL